MAKAIAYSLFGYGKGRQDNCFDFASYARGFMINLRMNRLIFPDWEICLQINKASYEPYKILFDGLNINLEIHDTAPPLTLAMLWRLRPVFDMKDSDWKYTHVLCRDLDSPPTYREAQAVKYWIGRDKALHAITDSVSHNLPLLGGMIGIRPAYFSQVLNVHTWKELINLNPNFNWEIKGSDQHFLNQVVYPAFAKHGTDSITQHYFNGMPNTFLSDYRTCNCPPPAGHESHCINNLEIDLPYEIKESNSVCGHIGASGAYMSTLSKFLYKHKEKFEDLIELERNYKDVFYWTENLSF